MSTRLGRELAKKLNPSIGTTPAITETCSLICRYASTVQRLAIAACNRELTARETEKDAFCEARIRECVAMLPRGVDGQEIGVEFQGDPRGYCVKLIMPDGRGDDWGGEGRMTVPVPEY